MTIDLSLFKQNEKYAEYTTLQFACASDFESYVRKNGTPDYFILRQLREGKRPISMLFTMQEYDMAGKSITYANLKHKLMIEVTTSDRYSSLGFTDAKVTMDELTYWRNDIVYAE